MSIKIGDVGVTAAQLRAARGLLNMSIAELCEITGLSPNTVKRAESETSGSVTRANLVVLVTTLEAHGARFLEAEGDFGPGVRGGYAEGGLERRPTRRRAKPGI